MKIIIILAVACLVTSACNQSGNNQQLQAKIDSLQAKVNDAYKPGLGEFMMGIQEHHAKLWFAGINKNWKLADFEVHEIGETLDDVKKYCTDRPEIKSLGIIDPAVNTIKAAISKQDIEKFKSGFTELTNDCNTCHKDNQHGFNMIIIPTSPPVTNQDFKPAK
ncbi:MAG: hypothetical protein JO080_12555 [Mucilaginibacter sp.]|nr:hypothetical protein [Mucilaginibacter sp.]